MIVISEEAQKQLREYKERQGPNSQVRIGIMSGSSTGPNLGISMDDVSDGDEIFPFDGFEIIVEKGLLEFCATISVEYVLTSGGGCGSGGGFKIIPENML